MPGLRSKVAVAGLVVMTVLGTASSAFADRNQYTRSHLGGPYGYHHRMMHHHGMMMHHHGMMMHHRMMHHHAM